MSPRKPSPRSTRMPVTVARSAPSVAERERGDCLHLEACRRLAVLAEREWAGCREDCLSYLDKPIYPLTLKHGDVGE